MSEAGHRSSFPTPLSLRMSDSLDLLDAMDLAYSETGSGLPLILIHGLGSSQRDWELQGPVFARHYRVVTVDLRGHGQSPKPKGPYRMGQLAADVALLLMRIHARPAHVIGLSLGGAVALQLAIDEPELLRSLVLVNTLPRFVSSSWRVRLLGMRRLATSYFGGMDTMADDVARSLFPLAEQLPLRLEAGMRLALNDPAAYRSCLWALVRFDVTFMLDLIRCPTLVVAGDRDPTLGLEAKRLLAQAIPDARFQVIADSGHATPIDQHEAFNALTTAFLAEVDAGGAPEVG